MDFKNLLLPKHLLSIGSVLMLLFFCKQMFDIVAPYTSGKADVDFLLSKQKIIHLQHYRGSFYLHIFSSLLILAAGLTQFSKGILQQASFVHRWIGKIYTFGILMVSAPAAGVMAFYANGGWVAKTSFLFLSMLWWYTTWEGWRAIQQKKIQIHQIWMIRSYALTLSAITLRVMQASFAAFTKMDLDTSYQMVSWASWMLNLGVAEWIIKKYNLKYFNS